MLDTTHLCYLTVLWIINSGRSHLAKLRVWTELLSFLGAWGDPMSLFAPSARGAHIPWPSSSGCESMTAERFPTEPLSLTLLLPSSDCKDPRDRTGPPPPFFQGDLPVSGSYLTHIWKTPFALELTCSQVLGIRTWSCVGAVWMDPPDISIHSSVGGLWGYMHFLVIMNNTLVHCAGVSFSPQ